MKKTYYKYRPLYQIGSKGVREPHQFTRSIFEKAEIRYSAPKDFNDPFDCNLRLHVADSTDAEWEEYIDILSQQYPDRAATLSETKAKKLWRSNSCLADAIGEPSLKMNYEESSVLCLSKKGNSIPMYSYYADSHQGIAIEFQFSDREVPCGIPFDEKNHRGVAYAGKVTLDNVEYLPTFPELNYHRLYNKPQLIKSLLFTKHHEWSHEEEFRIFRRGVPASNARFDKTFLTRVIFGCRTVSADVDLVKGWLVGWPSNVILAKAETATDQFQLRITDFETVKAK